MEFNFSQKMQGLDGSATREILKLLTRPEIVSFAGGLPANEFLPIKDIQKIADEIFSSALSRTALQYGATEGLVALRSQIPDFVKDVGIKEVKDENCLIISGGQQGIDLMMRIFINKGDTVLVENPTYLAALQIIKSHEGQAVGVKAAEYGLDLEDLEQKIIKHKPKLLYCVPTFSNPTGNTYPESNRREIAKITAKHNVVVIEDDPYGRLRFEGEAVKALKCFDEIGNVVYITSFSKILSPGLRVAIAVGDSTVIRKMAIAKQGADLHTSNLSQMITAEYLKKGLLEPNINKSLPVYIERKNALMSALDKYMPHEFFRTEPQGGLFVWGGFKNNVVDTREAFYEAIQNNAAYIKGSEFYVEKEEGKSFLRLNFSNESVERIDTGIKSLGNMFKKIIAQNK